MTIAEKLQNFINTYTGIPNVGDTKENKGQCVGLIEVWLDSLGTAHIWGNAKDLLANADKAIYDVIYNDPHDLTQHPNPGDVFACGASWGGGVGHTGLIVSATGTTWTGFEQNNPTGHAPQIITHNNYNGMLGWLRPKSTVVTQPSPQASSSLPITLAILNDQTKYDFGGDIGTQELGAIRSIINDTRRDLKSCQNQPQFTLANFSLSDLVKELLGRLKLG